MTKRSLSNSAQKEKSGSGRLGLGSFELPGVDSYSRKKVRGAFMRSLGHDVALSLYRKAFFQFLLWIWSQFRQTIPSSVTVLIEDKDFLAELERVTTDFSAPIYNVKSQSIHPAFIELLSPAFSRNRELVINYPRAILMQELLRPLRELSNSDRRIFQPSWATLQKKKKTKHLRELIIEWSRSWNLDKDWCRDYAVIALWAWLTDAQLQWQASWREQRLSFREASVEAHIDDILKMNDEITSSTDEDSANLISLLNQGFSFTWKGLDFQTYRWNPIAKYRADWARDCEVSFKTYLSRREKAGSISPPGVLGKFRAARDAYIRKMAQVTKQAGLVRTPRRWADEHLTWAVRFQVYNWPLSKIEKTYLKPRKTIADGINRMLAFIDLDRRDNLRAGMPKGTSLSGRRRIVRK